MTIPENNWFYFKHGRRASTIEELKSALDDIHEDEFRHHVTADKNDFANWVESIFGEAKLAKDMREVSEKDGMIILLDDFLDQKKKQRQEEEIAAEAAHDEPKPQPEEPKPVPVPEPQQEQKPASLELPGFDHKPARKSEHKREHREHKKVIIPEDKRLSGSQDQTQTPFYVPEAPPSKAPAPERTLSEHDIQALVEEAKEVFEKEHARVSGASHKPGKQEEHDDEGKIEKFEMSEREVDTEPVRDKDHPHYRFVVKEFIYGFLIGLIFGMIMSGVVLNLKP